MKRHVRNLWLSAAVLCVAVAAAGISTRSLAAAGEGASYQAVEWAQLPAGMKWGTMSAVAIDSKGNIYGFQRENLERGDESRVLIFDSKGKFLRSWGDKMFVLAHGLRIDKQDNVWVTDLRANVLQKYTPDGKLLFEFGKKGVMGDNTSTDLLNGPADMVVAPNGTVFIADGESTNTRVVKLSKEGKLIKFWGTKGTGNGEFQVPHSIAMDSKGRIYVADRTNNRVQVFDQDGNYLDQMANAGTPYGMFVAKDLLYVVDGKNNVLTIIDTKDKSVVGRIEGLNAPHMVTVDSSGAIYTAEQGLTGPGPAIRKYVKKQGATGNN